MNCSLGVSTAVGNVGLVGRLLNCDFALVETALESSVLHLHLDLSLVSSSIISLIRRGYIARIIVVSFIFLKKPPPLSQFYVLFDVLIKSEPRNN